MARAQFPRKKIRASVLAAEIAEFTGGPQPEVEVGGGRDGEGTWVETPEGISDTELRALVDAHTADASKIWNPWMRRLRELLIRERDGETLTPAETQEMNQLVRRYILQDMNRMMRQ